MDKVSVYKKYNDELNNLFFSLDLNNISYEKYYEFVLDLIDDENITLGDLCEKVMSNIVDNDNNKFDNLKDKEYVQTNQVKEYIEMIKKYPLLSIEEEKNLAIRVKNGDKDARKKLILSNLRLVVYVAKKYYGKLPFMDLIQSGNIGLMYAINNYDLNKNAKLSTYAIFWIKECIRRTVAHDAPSIHFSYKGYYNRKLYLYHKYSFYDINGRYPSIDELVKLTGISSNEIEFFEKCPLECKSLNDSISVDDDTELIDTVISSDDVEKIVISDNLPEAIKKAFDMAGFTEREKEILIYRFGFINNMPMKLEDIAKKFNISNERVRQIYTRAFRKLKRPDVYKYLGSFVGVDNKLNKNNISNCSLYDYLEIYTYEEIGRVIKILPVKERKIIFKRFGYNFENTSLGFLCEHDMEYLYNYILPKVKSHLELYAYCKNR